MEGQLLTDSGTCNSGERKEEELPGSSGWDRRAQQELPVASRCPPQSGTIPTNRRFNTRQNDKAEERGSQCCWLRELRAELLLRFHKDQILCFCFWMILCSDTGLCLTLR